MNTLAYMGVWFGSIGLLGAAVLGVVVLWPWPDSIEDKDLKYYVIALAWGLLISGTLIAIVSMNLAR